jgi:TrkA domain protein
VTTWPATRIHGDDRGEDMDLQETTLPGVGLRHDFTTQRGHQVGVVSYRTGRRGLLLYDLLDG